MALMVQQTLCCLQFLSAAASVSLSGNSGLCGGVPFGVSQQVQLLIDGTSLQYPCFSKDIDLVMSDQDSCPLSFSDQVLVLPYPQPTFQNPHRHTQHDTQ